MLPPRACPTTYLSVYSTAGRLGGRLRNSHFNHSKGGSIMERRLTDEEFLSKRHFEIGLSLDD